MSDNELLPASSRSMLAKLGVSAVTYLATGAFLMVMTIGARIWFLAIGLSVTALVIGTSALLSNDRADRKPGLLIIAVGVLGLLFQFGPPFLRPIAATILGFGGLGLLAAGVVKGVKFLLGLKSME